MNQTLKSNLAVLIVCLTIVASLAIVSRTGIYIKSLAGVDAGGKITNSISVSGDGKVTAKPDMAQINLGFQELAPTSSEALNKVNQKINTAIKILHDNGIPDTDITTDNFSVYTQYDYSNNGRRLLGQQASQSLTVKVKNMDDKATKAAKVIDALSGIDNVQLNGISFDIEDKTKLFTQAREAAFKKAEQKAKELASLSHVSLLKPVSISDSTYDVSPQTRYANSMDLKAAMPMTGGGESTISTGEMSVSANLSILWGIE